MWASCILISALYTSWFSLLFFRALLEPFQSCFQWPSKSRLNSGLGWQIWNQRAWDHCYWQPPFPLSLWILRVCGGAHAPSPNISSLDLLTANSFVSVQFSLHPISSKSPKYSPMLFFSRIIVCNIVLYFNKHLFSLIKWFLIVMSLLHGPLSFQGTGAPAAVFTCAILKMLSK